MNEIADELDPVLDKIQAEYKKIQKMLESWTKARAIAMPFVKDLLMLGCDLSYSHSYMYVSCTGDKDKFLKLVRLHRRHGHKPTIPSKGETQAMWFVTVKEFQFFVQFTSTVCHRVQTGTKMQEVPVYETVCEEFVPDAAELDGPGPAELPAPAPPVLEDTCPF